MITAIHVTIKELTHLVKDIALERNLPDGFLNRLSFFKDPQKGHFGRVSIHFAILGRRETLAASSTNFGNFSSTYSGKRILTKNMVL